MVLYAYHGNCNTNLHNGHYNKEIFEMNGLKQFFRGFKKGMGNFGYNIALIINTVLLTIVYLLGVGLTSIFAKAFRKHFLDMKSSNDSYWSDLNLKNKSMEECYRQF